MAASATSKGAATGVSSANNVASSAAANRVAGNLFVHCSGVKVQKVMIFIHCEVGPLPTFYNDAMPYTYGGMQVLPLQLLVAKEALQAPHFQPFHWAGEASRQRTKAKDRELEDCPNVITAPGVILDRQ